MPTGMVGSHSTRGQGRGCAYLSALSVISDAEGTHSNSGRERSTKLHFVPVISSMSPFVGLLMYNPVL